MPRPFSGKKVISVLCNKFGFYHVSQKGSHVKLATKRNNQEIITIVPIHREIAIGTLKGILTLAQVDEKEFRDKA